MAQSREALLVENIQQSPDVVEISQGLQDASFISVPLERKNPVEEESAEGDMSSIIAVLNVNRKAKDGRFTEGDLKILSIIANHAASAIDNVRLIRTVEDAHLSTLQSMALLLEAKEAYT